MLLVPSDGFRDDLSIHIHNTFWSFPPHCLWPRLLMQGCFPTGALPISWLCVWLVKLDSGYLQNPAQLTSTTSLMKFSPFPMNHWLSVPSRGGQSLLSPSPFFRRLTDSISCRPWAGRYSWMLDLHIHSHRLCGAQGDTAQEHSNPSGSYICPGPFL